jgi:predicted MFS family arabinose efflux permease
MPNNTSVTSDFHHESLTLIMFPRPPHLLWIPIFFVAYTLEFGTISLLPILTNRLNLSTSIDGVSMALFALSVAIMGPILGLLGSKVDYKKLIPATTFVLAGANVLAAFSTNLGWLFTARLLVLLIHPMLFPVFIAVAISWYSESTKFLITFSGILGTLSGLVLSVPLAIYLGNNFSYSASLATFAILDFLIGLTLINNQRIKMS